MDFKNRLLLALALTCLISVPAVAAPEDGPTAQAAVADILVARPLGVVVTAVGAVLFVVSLPFSAIGGNVGEAAKLLVVRPARETFVRCLGCRSVEQNRAPR